jgi:sulfite exporter TauE/SafE
VTSIPEAFLLGIATGPVCLGFCAPVLVPFFASGERGNMIRNMGLAGLFLSGRLSGYLMVGAIAGALGGFLSGPSMRLYSGVLTAAAGVLLLAFGAVKNFPELKLCRLLGRSEKTTLGFVALVGVLTGINLCPPFLAAITQAAGTGTMTGAVLYFLFFFFGTSVFIVPLFLAGALSRFKEIRYAARVCLLIAGGWLVLKGLFALCGA